ncbi:MAG TPA: Na+/H+ antiporter NhaA [Polyangiales bacterium]
MSMSDLPAPPGAWAPLRNVVTRAAGPLERFLHIEAASGIVLLLAALFAFGLANSPWASSYAAFFHTPLGIRIGTFTFERPLEWVVNDGLMVIFFFVVGLEIRREIHRGELSELKRAALPMLAAFGGVAMPALLYVLLAGGADTRHGWAVPTATDIAFAVGVLALLGKRVPPALRVLLLALAVIDDLAAIVVIAVFYSEGLAWMGLLVAAGGIGLVLVMQAIGVRTKLAYVAPGLIVWAGVYAAGVHPTIAGVVIGMITPVRAWLGADGFLQVAPKHYNELSRIVEAKPNDAHALASALHPLEQARREALSPAESLIEKLHPWVAYAIMPVFALANAGVSLGGTSLAGTSGVTSLAVVVGLVVGKPLGILGISALAIRLGLASLPAGLTFRHVVVLGVVAGIGFTMAIFVAQLAFSDATLLAAAKLGVLCASVLAGLLGIALGKLLLPLTPAHPDIAPTADDAERSTLA